MPSACSTTQSWNLRRTWPTPKKLKEELAFRHPELDHQACFAAHDAIGRFNQWKTPMVGLKISLGGLRPQFDQRQAPFASFPKRIACDRVPLWKQSISNF